MSRTEIGVHSVLRGRGKDVDHKKAVEEERRIRECSFDYGFPGDEEGPSVTVLVGRDRVTGMTVASVVPVKRTSGQEHVASMSVLDFNHGVGRSKN